jgi:hypothetical protein
LGSEKKIRRNKNSAFEKQRRTHTRRAQKAVAVDEGPLGCAQKSSSQVIKIGALLMLCL